MDTTSGGVALFSMVAVCKGGMLVAWGPLNPLQSLPPHNYVKQQADFSTSTKLQLIESFIDRDGATCQNNNYFDAQPF